MNLRSYTNTTFRANPFQAAMADILKRNLEFIIFGEPRAGGELTLADNTMPLLTELAEHESRNTDPAKKYC